MIVAAALSLSCIGSWVYMPQNLDSETAVSVTITSAERFEIQFSDYDRVEGPWRLEGSNILLYDNASAGAAPPAFRMADCDDDSATFAFEDGRTLILSRSDRDFASAVQEAGGWGDGIVSDGADFSFSQTQGDWTVSGEGGVDGDSSSRSQCIMRGPGASGRAFFALHFRDTVGEVDLGRNRIALNIPVSQGRISQLRATTSETARSGRIVLDGDVVLHGQMSRTGSNLSFMPDGDAATVLELLARGSTLTAYFGSERLVDLSLGGSARAVSAMQQCMAAMP